MDKGYCYGVEDGLDGYCIHTAKCPNYGKPWRGPDYDCIEMDRNG